MTFSGMAKLMVTSLVKNTIDDHSCRCKCWSGEVRRYFSLEPRPSGLINLRPWLSGRLFPPVNSNSDVAKFAVTSLLKEKSGFESRQPVKRLSSNGRTLNFRRRLFPSVQFGAWRS